MSWQSVLEVVKTYIVKIETPRGHGTGFLFTYNSNGSIAAIATALHVIVDSDTWREPMRIRTSNAEVFIPFEGRAVISDQRRDSAAIVLPASSLSPLKLPSTVLEMMDKQKFCRVGTALGWMGFPSVAPDELCFFQGYVSAFDERADRYLIDGVAINGVSGGPVFREIGADKHAILVGMVSAYHANMQRDAVLPGLLSAQDLSHLETVVENFKNLDEARKAAEENKAEKPANPKEPMPKTDN